MPAGRPSLYTKENCDEICYRLAQGETLKAICLSKHMPAEKTVHKWLKQDDKREFRDSYGEAKTIQYDVLAESILDISAGDPATDTLLKVNRDRLKMQGIQWYVGKMTKKYADKPEMEAAPVASVDITKLTDKQLDLYVDLLKIMGNE